VFGARRRIRGVGGAGRPRPHRARGDDHGGGQNLACRAGLCEAEAIRLSARTNCGRPGCWRRMRVITGRMPATRAWHPGPKGRCARSWRAHDVNPHKIRYYLSNRSCRLTHSSAFWKRRTSCIRRVVRIEWAIDRSADRTGRLEGLRLLLAEREKRFAICLLGSTARPRRGAYSPRS
jgi:hypothetical protein